MRRFHRRLELLEEAKVGFVEEAYVFDVVLEHRHALDAKAPRVSVPLVGIDAPVAQHLRVDHSTPPDLQPAFVPAALAAGAGADPARYVELEARLGEWEVARAHADFPLLSVEPLDHVKDRALHIAAGQ